MIKRLFYTVFNNIDVFRLFKWIVIFIIECVAMYLGFLGFACLVNPDMVDKSFVASASFRNNYYVYLTIIFLTEGIRNITSSIFFDRKITYISGSTIERIKKIKVLCMEFYSFINEIMHDSDKIHRFCGVVLIFVFCILILLLLPILVYFMYGFILLFIEILMY